MSGYPESIHPDLKLIYANAFGSKEFKNDLVEYPENPTRSPRVYEALQRAVDNPVGGIALSITSDFTLGSGEGDENGVAIVEDNSSPRSRNGRILKIARRALSGFSLEDLWRITWRMLAWGDAFASTYEKDGMITPVLLPTWQVHLITDEWTGQVVGAQQGRPGIAEDKWRELDLNNLIHWCYRKNHIYGKALLFEVTDACDYYSQNSVDIKIASREAALVPTLHIFPEGADEIYREAYRRDHEAQKKKGPVADFYLPAGANIQKPFGGVAQFPINAMTEAIKIRRLEIAVASRVPLYLLGIADTGKSNALQPAMAFRGHIGRIRSILAEGLRVAIDRILIKQGFNPPFGYRFQFPRLDLNVIEQTVHHDVQAPGIIDTDSANREMPESI